MWFGFISFTDKHVLRVGSRHEDEERGDHDDDGSVCLLFLVYVYHRLPPASQTEKKRINFMRNPENKHSEIYIVFHSDPWSSWKYRSSR